MRKHLLGLMLVAGLAGCTSDHGTDPAASRPATADPLVASDPAQALPSQREPGTGFASLPDRGQLLAYGDARKVRQSGAYTFHPVSLSEEHALNAIATGKLVVPTPGGENVELAYERHEEHADGNWSWIGRGPDGEGAVLTFGDQAVFGMVSHRGQQLRVRTDRDGAWVVTTDPTRLPPGRHDHDDVLLPPEQGMAAAARRVAAKAAPAVPGKAVAVIDVLIGYSSGLAQQLGGASAAGTRASYLVAQANQAYANSGVNMRLRPVYALQVNYADNSSNEDALQQMTGYDAGAGRDITPNAAFDALRKARDEYGADLVAFLRRYREPEHAGCGIAWLLGMNGSGIQAARDADFGYAVISDGEDLDEGDGQSYFCSDFSLAHELGHLMGQAHNQEDAAGRAGVHSYSYGYRETSSSGFFTIMAYPLGDGQLEIPHFANPSVRYQNRPTGSAGADNVRSMNQTMPIISAFRATVVPLPYTRNDVDGNGFGDILWEHTGNRQFAYWLMNGASRTGSSTMSNIANGYRLIATGDFNADGRADLVWSNPSLRDLYIWLGNGNGGFTARSLGTYPAGWALVGTGDANRDGKSDLYWFNASTRQYGYWLMDGGRRTGSRTFNNAGAGFSVAGIGDFNADGYADTLWVNPTTRELYLWSGNASGGINSARVSTYPAGWQVAGVGDVSGDGATDILWTHPASRQFGYWEMAGSKVRKTTTIGNVGAGYTIAAVTDYDGDGREDVLWVNTTQRQLYIWLMKGDAAYTSRPVGTYPAGWTIVR
jgi:hypothetical protein